MFVLFGSTYICEQTFSIMKFTKSRYRSSLTDDHLSAVLRISTSDIQPDFDALVKAQQRLDFSHWDRKNNLFPLSNSIWLKICFGMNDSDWFCSLFTNISHKCLKKVSQKFTFCLPLLWEIWLHTFFVRHPRLFIAWL